MNKKKLLAFICAFAMLASSFGAMSAYAADDTTGDTNVSDGTGGTEGTEGDTAATPAPADPLTPLTVTALPKDTTVTFDAGYADNTKTTFTEPSMFGEYVAVYAGEYDGGARNIEIDGSNKTFEDTRKYTTRLKFGGAVVYDADNAPAIRTVSVTPAEAGTLVVDFGHASNNGDPRTLAAYQNGAEIGTKEVEAGGLATLAVSVAADAPVYLYSKSSGINLYGIFVTDNYTAPEEPDPVAPVEVTPLPVGAQANFANDGLADRQQITEQTLLGGGYIAAYATASKYLEARTSNKTIGGVSYSVALRTNGGATVGGDGIPTDRAIMVTPAEAGLLSVDFGHGSGEGTAARSLAAVQNGAQIGMAEVEGGGVATLSVKVAAGAPVYIYSPDNVNIFGVRLDAVIESEPLPAGTRVTFDAGYDAETETGTVFADKTVFEKYTLVYASAEKSIDVRSSNKTIRDHKYSTAVRLNAAELSGNTPTVRALSVTPAEAGTLTVDFSHPGTGEARNLMISQDDVILTTQAVVEGGDATAAAEVAAGSPVYIYTDSGINVYGILLGEEGIVTPPTDDPGGDEPADKDIVKITAIYNESGVLQSVAAETVKASEAGEPVLTGTTKTFYWESFSSMKPYAAGSDTPSDTPSELTAVNESRTWTFSQDTYASYGTSATDENGNVTVSISTDVVVNGLKLIGSKGSLDIDNSNKTFDEVKYEQRIKLGGSGAADKRALSFLPGVDGTLTICAVSSNTDPKTLTVEGAEPGTCTITSETVSQTVSVKGGTPVTLYGDGGVNIYALIYTPAAQ